MKYGLVILGALVCGAVLFPVGYYAMDFAWSHFVIDPQQASAADGVIVIFGGIALGIVFGGTGAVLIARRFWPRRA